MMAPPFRLPLIADSGWGYCAPTRSSLHRWLMLGVLLVHALLLPRIAVQPRVAPGSRETEHEVRIETAWRGAEEEELESAQARRAVSWWAEVAARRPLSKSRWMGGAHLLARVGRGELLNRNGSGGPLRC
jgi:hypothetical protein